MQILQAVHIIKIDYIGINGQLLISKDVDLWLDRSAIDSLMNFFQAFWNMTHHEGCTEVLCSYKDYSKPPKKS